MKWISGAVFSLALSSSHNVVTASKATAWDVLEWINNTEGGLFNPKQELRNLDADNPNSTSIGIFAKEDIAAGEELLIVPWSLIIKSKDQTEEGQMCCGTVRAVVKEMKLGEKSDYYPYSEYLNQEDPKKLPSAWSEEGKDLLYQIVGIPKGHDPRISDFDCIPPEEPVEWLEIDYHGHCNGPKRDPVANLAALLVLQRSDDSIMIPGYDLYNHRSGKYHNTDIRWERGKPHITKASRRIKKGEQIYNSYYMCAECENRHQKYGVGELLRDYGFIEDYPQRYYYSSLGGVIQFDIDINGQSGEPEIVNWEKEMTPKDEYLKFTRVWLERQIRKQRRIKNIYTRTTAEEMSIPSREWKTIWEFHRGNIIAMKLALRYLNQLSDPRRKKEDSCQNGACDGKDFFEGHHYDTLNYETDDLDYISPTCDNDDIMQFDDYGLMEKIQTNYQPVGFEYMKEDDDVCMDIDNIVQICSCYRPHYHEFVTHYAARFVDKIKRVLFVGGGDSMLLHEALKYPDLELVVGLELDQTVTRKSFKYFRTQPHFDDPRVEWWFGDATKSMLLLPKDYWGSFDLVLVDLSETVMSLSVTKEMDVFDALALLLNPDGIIVKNELYLEHFSKVFDYTIQILYDSPIICSQVVALGSNRVDFLHADGKDHKIPNFLYEPNLEDENRYFLVHDYRKSDAHDQGKCGIETPVINTDVQDSSAGIMEIVNAEEVEISLDEGIIPLIQEVAKDQGFRIGPNRTYMGNMEVVVMKEGYITARLWPEKKYVGLDINLWGKTYKIKELKAALIEALKTKVVSSYKVVVGGMFGSSTWKEDYLHIGPYSKTVQNMNRNCDEKPAKPEETKPFNKEVLEMAIAETITIAENSVSGLTIRVLCGLKGSNNGCLSLDVAKKVEGADVFPFYTCEGLNKNDDSTMYECEKDLVMELEDSIAADGQIDIILVDSDVPYQMLQIMSSTLSIDQNLEVWLNKVNAVMAFGPRSETARRYFLDRLRIQHGEDPVARGEFILDSPDSDTMELGVVICGDASYMYNLETIEYNLKERLKAKSFDVDVELKIINAGLFPYDYQFDPTTFKQEDYDSAPGRKQYEEQEPLGRQNIFQLGLAKADVNGPISVGNLSGLAGTKIDIDTLFGWLKGALRMSGYDISSGNFGKSQNIGDGAMVVYANKVANAILVWDGKTHIDISFFTFDEGRDLEKPSRGIPDMFIAGFIKESKFTLQTNLRDDQPRGIGRVINFPSDIALEYEEEDDGEEEEEEELEEDNASNNEL